MTYEQMLNDLDNIPMFGNAAGLDNLSSYLAYFNHPEDVFRVIHVAGTNGKGSVCAYLESIFRNAGYTTGLFTSPHLTRINERIRLDFVECDDQDMVDAWLMVKNAIDQREKLGLKMLTYFEILFLMAMLIFAKKKPDICIVETGLGGRLDATVLTKPIATVITSISLDHTGILGDTIEKIAEEKAGILKENIPAVVFRQKDDSWKVIKKRAEEVHAPLYFISEENLMLLKKDRNSIDFSVDSRYYKCDLLTVSSGALYQMSNAALAALTASLAKDTLTNEQIVCGIKKMSWEGRMEEVMPGLYVDGAHNPGAITQITRMVETETGRWKLLFAVCQDKDYHTMISTLSSCSWDEIYVTHFDGVRAADASEIYREVKMRASCPVYFCEDVEKAFGQISYDEDHPLLCLGSLYLVGEIKALIKRRK